jgi:hypothetical protein
MASPEPILEGNPEERIRVVLDSLVRERRQLRGGNDRAALEANRMGIIYWRHELSQRARKSK